MQTSTALEEPATARGLLTQEEFAGVAATVLDHNAGMEQDVAERIVEEALKFVATAAAYPSEVLVPSRIVDEGWHALVEDTRLYGRLCGILGYFVHHRPERPDPTRFNQQALDRTQARIVDAGYEVDRTLWLHPTDPSIPVAASCQHSDDGGTIVITPKPK